MSAALSPLLESYLTQVSNRLGMATKAVGVVATVTLPFIILTFAQLALGLTILAGLKWRKLL